MRIKRQKWTSSVLCIAFSVQAFLSPLTAQAVVSRKVAVIEASPSKTARLLREKLDHDFDVIPEAAQRQLLSLGSERLGAQSQSTVYQEMDGILDRYYSYRADTKKTILELEAFLSRQKNEAGSDRQLSPVRLSALLTLSWLHFHVSQREKSKKILEKILAISPHTDLELDTYPRAYRRFVGEVRADLAVPKNANLRVTS